MSTPPPARTNPAPPGTAAAAGPDDAPPHRYTARLADQIERHWQRFWEEHCTFVQPNPGQPGFDASRPKFYCLDMFPYPSGAGLHVGHPLSYTATDIVSRFMRMQGRNVLHPMGWDAFGLPAEQYAIQTGIHPSLTTKQATDNFRRQLKRFGFSYDWSREISTIDPEYYKWTQWIFLRAYNAWYDPKAGAHGNGKARPINELIAELEGGDLRIGVDGELVHVGAAAATGFIGGEPVGTRRWHELSADEQRAVIDDQRLAYIDEAIVNWCPKLGTVLANDEVIDGRSERGGHPVLRKPLRQWMFRITAYAERLLRDLDTVDWPSSTKAMQSEWIGRSEGAEVDFPVAGQSGETIRVFTTRPDTIFGATFMVVAPEHPMVQAALEMKSAPVGADFAALRAYVTAAKNRSDVDRMADTKEKSGVFTGLYCENPASGESIPVWTADYVLMGYGHGAIMAVPAHDERDFEFAQKFNLPIRDVVYPRTQLAIGFYARHATREEETSGAWKTVLADFLGLTTTGDIKPDMFGAVLDAVRTRRESPPSPPQGEAAAHFTPRGMIAAEYIEAIEDVGSLEELRKQYRDCEVFADAGAAFGGHGYAANSSREGKSTADSVTLDLLPTDEAKQRIIAWLEKTGRGNRKVNYKLRDWAFSRQRYWGEPFPIVFDAQGRHYPVSDKALPVTLPELADYSPVESDDPMPLLAKATSWMNTTAGAAGVSPDLLPPSTPVRREANTMPGSAGSSWYFLRYCDAKNSERFVGREAERYWLGGGTSGGTDIYIGGSEHAVGHLLYSRFWQKILFDLGEVESPEPFGKLYHQGLITSFAYQRADKTIVPTDEVKEISDGKYVVAATGESVTPVVTKMSKRYKNVVNPDDVIAEFGADTFRMYEMYMGPLDQSKPWNTKDAVGIFRFLQRLWRLAVDEQSGELKLRPEADAGVEKQLHRTIHKVAQDVPRLAFNTAIASLIEFVNAATSAGGLSRDQLERVALTLAPFAPHLSEELWHRLGKTGSLAYEPFPPVDAKQLVDDAIEVAVQVGGKIRTKIMIPTGADKAAYEAAAMADEKVQAALAGKTIQKVIVVPGKLINIVAT